MTYYELEKMLKAYSFIPIKVYENRTIWEKNGKQLTVPTSYDTISISLGRKLKESIKSF